MLAASVERERRTVQLVIFQFLSVSVVKQDRVQVLVERFTAARDAFDGAPVRAPPKYFDDAAAQESVPDHFRSVVGGSTQLLLSILVRIK